MSGALDLNDAFFDPTQISVIFSTWRHSLAVLAGLPIEFSANPKIANRAMYIFNQSGPLRRA